MSKIRGVLEAACCARCFGERCIDHSAVPMRRVIGGWGPRVPLAHMGLLFLESFLNSSRPPRPCFGLFACHGGGEKGHRHRTLHDPSACFHIVHSSQQQLSCWTSVSGCGYCFASGGLPHHQRSCTAYTRHPRRRPVVGRRDPVARGHLGHRADVPDPPSRVEHS